MSKIQYVDCECQSEILRLEYFDDDLSDEEKKQGASRIPSMLLSVYENNVGHRRMGLLEKIKLTSRIFFKGTFYTDQMILNTEGINKLKKYLNELEIK